MSKIKRFIVEIHEDDIDPRYLEDLEGEVSEAIGSYFLLDAGVGYGVNEIYFGLDKGVGYGVEELKE